MATDFVQVAAIPNSFWKVQYTTGGLQPYQANLCSTYKRKKKYINTLYHAIALQATAIQSIQDRSHTTAVTPKIESEGGVVYKT